MIEMVYSFNEFNRPFLPNKKVKAQKIERMRIKVAKMTWSGQFQSKRANIFMCHWQNEIIHYICYI